MFRWRIGIGREVLLPFTHEGVFTMGVFVLTKYALEGKSNIIQMNRPSLKLPHSNTCHSCIGYE